MNDFIIFTDSSCDISPETLGEWGVSYSSLTFTFDDSEKQFTNDEMSAVDFYNKMREGHSAKTSAVNVESFVKSFEPHLSAGHDVLYLGFSSGLSNTYNSGRIAAEQLRVSYPERKIIAVDTLSASAGFGLLLYLAVQKKESGASIDETASYVRDTVPHLCHWFTVDDLDYLKRGGRISPTVAFIGKALGIKPVLHMDNEGHLINMSKVRGRKASLDALADKYGQLAEDPENGTVFISNGDCAQDVEYLSNVLHDRYNAKVKLVTYVGPVIGAHTGPGVLALFFIGKER